MDDGTRVSYVEVTAYEKGPTTVGFLGCAVAWINGWGIDCRSLLSDNGSAYKPQSSFLTWHSRSINVCWSNKTCRCLQTPLGLKRDEHCRQAGQQALLVCIACNNAWHSDNTPWQRKGGGNLEKQKCCTIKVQSFIV